MPQFLDVDYFSEVIIKQRSFISKALLPEVTHRLYYGPGSKDKDFPTATHKVLEALTLHEEKLEGDSRGLDVIFESKMNIIPDSSPVLETFENSEAIYDLVATLPIEVIPNSNPDSLSSSYHDYHGSALLKEQFKPVCIKQEGLEGELEKLMCQNDLQSTVLKFPTTQDISSRLSYAHMEDPLLKKNGEAWNEMDFFQEKDTVFSSSDDVNIPCVSSVKKEEFCKHCLKNDDSLMHKEPFLLPYVVSNDFEKQCQSVFDSCSLNAWRKSKESLDLGPVIKDKLLLEKPQEYILEQFDGGLHQLSCDKHVMTFLEMNAKDSKVSKSCQDIFNKTSSSPIMSLPKVCLDNCQQIDSCVHLALEYLRIEEDKQLITKGNLLDEQQKTKFERRVHGDDQKFDSAQFQEPHLPPFNMKIGFTSLETVKKNLKLTSLNEPYTIPIFKCDHNEHVHFETESFTTDIELPEIYNLDHFQKKVILQPEKFIKKDPPELTIESNIETTDEIIIGVDPTSEPSHEIQANLEENMTVISSGPVQFNDSQADTFEKNKKVEDRQLEEIDFNNLQIDLDPLDSFIHVLAKQSSVKEKVKETKTTMPDVQCKMISSHGMKITDEFKQCDEKEQNRLKEDLSISSLKSIEVPFEGPFEAVLKDLQTSGRSHFERIKSHGMVKRDCTFMSLKPDQTRFMLKEVRRQQMLNKEERNISRSLSALHVHRVAAELLLSASLESVITYMASIADSNSLKLGGALNDLRQKLFHHQCKFVESNIKHPKLVVLVEEMHRFTSSHLNSKILIVLVKEKNMLQVIQDFLATSDIFVVNVWSSEAVKEEPINEEGKIKVTITEFLMCEEVLRGFSLVLEYDRGPSSKSATENMCKTREIQYIGLSSYVPHQSDFKDDVLTPVKGPPFTVLCSPEATQHRDLLRILECRYNIMIIERDYTELEKHSIDFYYADIIISPEECVVLLSLSDLNEDWDVDAFGRRLVGLGLQFVRCYIIAHSIGGSNRYILDRVRNGHLCDLRGSLSTLHGASKNFNCCYKIQLASNAESVSRHVSSLTELYSSTHPDCQRAWLSSDVTQEEAFLLQFSSINALTAQSMLQTCTLEQLMVMTGAQLEKTFIDIHKSVFKFFLYQREQLKEKLLLDCSSSQTSCEASDKSFDAGLNTSKSHINSPHLSPKIDASIDKQHVVAKVENLVNSDCIDLTRDNSMDNLVPKCEMFRCPPDTKNNILLTRHEKQHFEDKNRMSMIIDKKNSLPRVDNIELPNYKSQKSSNTVSDYFQSKQLVPESRKKYEAIGAHQNKSLHVLQSDSLKSSHTSVSNIPQDRPMYSSKAHLQNKSEESNDHGIPKQRNRNPDRIGLNNTFNTLQRPLSKKYHAELESSRWLKPQCLSRNQDLNSLHVNKDSQYQIHQHQKQDQNSDERNEHFAMSRQFDNKINKSLHRSENDSYQNKSTRTFCHSPEYNINLGLFHSGSRSSPESRFYPSEKSSNIFNTNVERDFLQNQASAVPIKDYVDVDEENDSYFPGTQNISTADRIKKHCDDLNLDISDNDTKLFPDYVEQTEMPNFLWSNDTSKSEINSVSSLPFEEYSRPVPVSRKRSFAYQDMMHLNQSDRYIKLQKPIPYNERITKGHVSNDLSSSAFDKQGYEKLVPERKESKYELSSKRATRHAPELSTEDNAFPQTNIRLGNHLKEVSDSNERLLDMVQNRRAPSSKEASFSFDESIDMRDHYPIPKKLKRHIQDVTNRPSLRHSLDLPNRFIHHPLNRVQSSIRLKRT